jgi:uncharacterized iron-regulated protein
VRRLQRILAATGAAIALGACAAESAMQTSHAADCPKPGAWYALDGATPRPAPAAEILERAAQGEVVLLGERHDVADHHRWQLYTLAALYAQRPDMAIGFESFPRRVQPVLDRWVAGELDATQFFAQTDWKKVWNYPPQLYLPLFEFARIHHIPMFAMNVERDLTRDIGARGWDAIPEARREGLSRPAPAGAEYRASLYEIYRRHPGRANSAPKKASPDDPEFQHFVESQTTWDRAMAQAIVSRLDQAALGQRPLVVGIAGSGHLRNGFGVAHQLRDLGVDEITTLLPIEVPEDCKFLVAGLADAVFTLPPGRAEPRPRPRLGVQLTQKGDRVEIVDVLKDSLAASMDLRAGDVIVSMAGVAVTRLDAVIAAVRAQPPGTWLPIALQRGDTRLELVIKFPPTKSKE